VVANSGSGEIAVFSPSGRLLQVVRSPYARHELTRDDVSQLKRERLARSTDLRRRQEAERILQEAPYPEKTPAFGSILLDEEGSLWVQEYPMPGTAQTAWSVLDAGGAVLARVEIPRTLEIYQIGPDFVLGRARDELDVEQVQLFSLRRER
jgi:hypothetical protein